MQDNNNKKYFRGANVHTINNLGELLNILVEWDNGALDLKTTMFYRGHSDYEFCLIPKIFRNQYLPTKEDNLLKSLFAIESKNFPSNMSLFDKISKAQHYGMPTRLLDITSNPLIALYFSVFENFEKDGEIYVMSILNDDIKYSDDLEIEYISKIAKLDDREKINIEKSLDNELNSDLKNLQISGMNALELKKCINSIYCVSPNKNNDRLIAQSGAFLFFGRDISKLKKDSANYFAHQRIRIPASSKKYILQELKILEIDDNKIFPSLTNSVDNILGKHI